MNDSSDPASDKNSYKSDHSNHKASSGFVVVLSSDTTSLLHSNRGIDGGGNRKAKIKDERDKEG